MPITSVDCQEQAALLCVRAANVLRSAVTSSCKSGDESNETK